MKREREREKNFFVSLVNFEGLAPDIWGEGWGVGRGY